MDEENVVNLHSAILLSRKKRVHHEICREMDETRKQNDPD